MAELIGSLEAEVDAEMRGLTGVFLVALDGVITETKDRLKQHVKKDVYDRWKPTEYIRRDKNGGIIDIDGSSGVNGPFPQTQGKNIAAGFELRYRPSGESAQWKYPANNNELIGRIESGTGYEWREHPGPRPFWTNFVNEMIEQNEFGDAVRRELAMLGVDVEGFPEAVRGSGDGDY